MRGTPKDRVRKNHIQAVEIGADSRILGERNHESIAQWLHNGKRLVGELSAILLPDVPTGQQVIS